MVKEDSWLSGLFGRKAFQVDHESAPAAFDEKEPAFYYLKIDTSDIASVRRFCELGFYTVDVNVTFSRAASAPALPFSGQVVRVGPEHADAVLEIAGSCFKYSRFHLDPAVAPDLAHRVKREWVRSYVEGRRGEALYTVLDSGKPAGFLAVLLAAEGGRKTAVIDLVGIAAGRQGRGLGRMLTSFFVNEYRGRCEELLVGTQAANIPSIRLYESCGFSVSKTNYVLHKHIR